MRRSLGPYRAGYCEAEQEVVRGPHGSYESEYRVQEYGYPHRPNHHHGGGYAAGVGVAEVVSYESNPGYLSHHHHNHHHGGVAEVIEKREDIIYDDACVDPCRRRMY